MKTKKALLNVKYTVTVISFLLPGLLLYFIFMLLPIFDTVNISFTDWNGMTADFNFVGFQNFFNVFKEKRIADATRNTLQFTFFQTVLVNVVGLGMAMLIKKATIFNRFLRTMFFMPFMCSIVFAAFIWSYFYSNVFEGFFGIVNPLSRIKTVIPGIAIIALWRDAGYAMLIYIAALQAVPESLYEAARIDGATPAQSFFKITLPLIVPAITINVTLFIGWGLKTFDYVMAATGGGPGTSSETIAMLVYYYTFPWNRAGIGQAFALLMMAGIVIVTQIVTRTLRAREVEL
jgi:raffinose/stachyose/melibiose transport system permease protein